MLLRTIIVFPGPAIVTLVKRREAMAGEMVAMPIRHFEQPF